MISAVLEDFRNTGSVVPLISVYDPLSHEAGCIEGGPF